MLETFYKEHDEEKLKNLPSIVAKYKGKYSKLSKALKKKYGDDCPNFSALLKEEQQKKK